MPQYTGTARSLHDWSSLDTQYWISFGTECKLYLVNLLSLYDITPSRNTSTVTDPFTTTLGSAIVTVVDADHGLADGDHVNFISQYTVGGIQVYGSYAVTSIIDPDTYTVTAVSVATSAATGGGEVTIEYDITCGLAENGELTGYGTGDYDEGTYGTPRAAGTGVPAKLRSWSLANWGEDLVASYSDGELYWWDKDTGPLSRARLVQTAPTNIQRMLVDVEFRRIILLGCTDPGGNPDRMYVAWCSSEDIQDWDASNPSNTAGGKRLDLGSRIVTGTSSRTQKLVLTDTQLYAMQAISASDYGFDPKGACTIAGPNAMIDVNGIAYWMGDSDFYIYDGTLRVLECDVWTHVFDNIDRDQLDKVTVGSFMLKNEITWFYQVIGDAECGNYVTFNYAERCWYYGTMQRTAYHDASSAISERKQYPYAANNGYLYQHEIGTDEVEGTTTNAMEWHLETGDGSVGGSDQNYLINDLVPDFDRLEVGMRITVKTKDRPRQADYEVSGPYELDTYDTDVDVRANGSQIAFRFDPAVDENGDTELGQSWRMGHWQVGATPYGGR